jgi:superfamily II DNA helicase RecQ
LEDYYQQIGRAGRDGKKATCVLLHNPKDVTYYSSWSMQLQARSSLQQLHGYCVDGTSCRWSSLCSLLGEKRDNLACKRCDNCRLVPHLPTRESDFTDVVFILLLSLRHATRQHQGKPVAWSKWVGGAECKHQDKAEEELPGKPRSLHSFWTKDEGKAKEVGTIPPSLPCIPPPVS